MTGPSNEPAVSQPRTTFINARMVEGIGTLSIAGEHIVARGEAPRPTDRIVDLQGDRLLPGLINAHDHLQLNHLGSLPAKPYRHVTEWITDVTRRRRVDAAFEARIKIDRGARLLAGGLKNLLSGVTTVAHHDPLYESLTHAGFPVRVVEHYGWSHSLYIEGERAVRSSHRSTPAEYPWIIHAAEGIDRAAFDEFDCLDALGCIGPNTLLVHGITLDPDQRALLRRRAAGLVWCPASNLRLFGRTADVPDLVGSGRVAVGTDSRLSGSRDLLEECRVAARACNLGDHALMSLVTRNAARLLRLSDRGVLRVGALADLLVLPHCAELGSAARSDVRLVLWGGMPRYGDYSLLRAVEPRVESVDVRVDGRRKALEGATAASWRATGIAEPGFEFAATSRAA